MLFFAPKNSSVTDKIDMAVLLHMDLFEIP